MCPPARVELRAQGTCLEIQRRTCEREDAQLVNLLVRRLVEAHEEDGRCPAFLVDVGGHGAVDLLGLHCDSGVKHSGDQLTSVSIWRQQ